MFVNEVLLENARYVFDTFTVFFTLIRFRNHQLLNFQTMYSLLGSSAEKGRVNVMLSIGVSDNLSRASYFGAAEDSNLPEN